MLSRASRRSRIGTRRRRKICLRESRTRGLHLSVSLRSLENRRHRNAGMRPMSKINPPPGCDWSIRWPSSVRGQPPAPPSPDASQAQSAFNWIRNAPVEESMTEHPNALLIHQAWQAISVGDVETVKALWAEDIVWHVTGDNPWAGITRRCRRGTRISGPGRRILRQLRHYARRRARERGPCGPLLPHLDQRDGRVLKTNQVLLARAAGPCCEVWTLSLDPESVRRFSSRPRVSPPADCAARPAASPRCCRRRRCS